VLIAVAPRPLDLHRRRYPHRLPQDHGRQADPTFSREAGSCLRALGWRSKTERPGPGLPPAKVFLSPSEQRERGTIPGAIGPQEDAPFL
jgi:hypothetical protein